METYTVQEVKGVELKDGDKIWSYGKWNTIKHGCNVTDYSDTFIVRLPSPVIDKDYWKNKLTETLRGYLKHRILRSEMEQIADAIIAEFGASPHRNKAKDRD